MEQVNLKKYRITSVEDALSVLEEAGDVMVYIYISCSSDLPICLFHRVWRLVVSHVGLPPSTVACPTKLKLARPSA